MSGRYLALGDSYTIGEGVAADARWPLRLAAALGIEAPTLVATTGWTTDELALAMDTARFEPPYDLVSLLIGVNNQYRGYPLDAYRAEFRALLARAVALAGNRAGHVLALSIPDWGVTPFAAASGRDTVRIGTEIDTFNAAARAEVHAAGAHWVDITGISRRTGEALAADGLHPAAAQYAHWAEHALPVAAAALASA
ncbi:MAG: SGNH/GDSL hydrolase family protein [Rhodanobacter sp.]|nr:MAG: SGNH/GDSL hydrolase family protein [Rhodanobacter sp.]TAM15072.1 MAG: SGNH/GDSL hydrolase family protein [Rhodanobacter sp.]TAM36458.1 MAG: SGNH/GDSL hydrolase family protein [Rhodanobacter sp.]